MAVAAVGVPSVRGGATLKSQLPPPRSAKVGIATKPLLREITMVRFAVPLRNPIARGHRGQCIGSRRGNIFHPELLWTKVVRRDVSVNRRTCIGECAILSRCRTLILVLTPSSRRRTRKLVVPVKQRAVVPERRGRPMVSSPPNSLFQIVGLRILAAGTTYLQRDGSMRLTWKDSMSLLRRCCLPGSAAKLQQD